MNVDRNLSLSVTAAMLADLYRVQTSASALDRWEVGEAERLPSIGQLIQQLKEQAQKTTNKINHLFQASQPGTVTTIAPKLILG